MRSNQGRGCLPGMSLGHQSALSLSLKSMKGLGQPQLPHCPQQRPPKDLPASDWGSHSCHTVHNSDPPRTYL
eukprot:1145642-Pelagomonas_calceolata.AAC.2